MSDTVRLGVIGLGNIGLQHIGHVVAGAVPRCQVTAVSSRRAHPIAEEIGAAHFSDYRELLDSGQCDAVLVASPTHAHREMGGYVLAAGLHLLMEKPLGLSIGEGQHLLDQTGPAQQFGLMLNQRTDPVFVAMKALLDAGVLGEIQRTHWTMTNWFRPEAYFQVSDWRATWAGEGGGLLVNQCIHNLDIFQWLCGMPTRLHGFCGFGRYHNIEVEDEATAYLEYSNGATGVFIGSTGEAPGVNRFDVIGDAGSLSYDGSRLLHRSNSPGTAEYSRATRELFGTPECAESEVDVGPAENQHAVVIANFVSAILDGDALLAPAQEGLASLGLANGILLSSWTGAPVQFPLDVELYEQALATRVQASVPREKQDLDVVVDMDKSYR